MAGWLTDSLVSEKAPPEMAGRIVAGVEARVAQRRRMVRLGSVAASLTAVAGLLAVFSLGLSHQVPKSVTTAQAPPVAAHRAAPPVEILSVVKAGGTVILRWNGSSDAEYKVFRCSSPRFDECSLSGRVKGTNWLDTTPEDGKITYYRVESKG